MLLPRRFAYVLLLLLVGACQPNSSTSSTQSPSRSAPAVPVDTTINSKKTASAPYEGTRRYTGRVGTYPVVMELTFTDTSTAGTYYYQRHGEELTLRAAQTPVGQPLFLGEVIGDSLLATWQARQPAGPRLQGMWRSTDGKRQLPFDLQEDYRDAVRYTYEQFSARSPTPADSVDCGQPGVTPSLELEVVHFLNSEHQPQVQRVQQQVLPAPYAGLGAYVKEQVSNGNGDCAEIKKRAYVTYNANYLLSVTLFEQVYSFGTPHPTHELRPLTFDLCTGHVLQLRELLRPGYEQPLRRLLTAQLQRHYLYGDFYQEEGGNNGQPFERWLDAQGRPQALVPLPQSGFRLTPKGMEFEWGEYEIGPYSIGPQTVELSYREMRPLLRPNSALRGVLAHFN